MKICVWRTGHEIADRVAEDVYGGLSKHSNCKLFHVNDRHGLIFDAFDVHIAYGILRGTSDIFKRCDGFNKPYFILDKGYLKPGHYDGYYRISLGGTQHTQGGDYADYKRLGDLGISFRNWRGLDPDKPVLICPPTDHVIHWIPEAKDWLRTTIRYLNEQKLKYTVRLKDASPKKTLNDDLRNCNYVHTFNSSVGWEALRQGIPCVSDTTYSLIGSHFGHISLDKLSHSQDIGRHELFASMSGLQLSLQEIKSGLLWPLMSKMLSQSTSATMAARQ